MRANGLRFPLNKKFWQLTVDMELHKSFKLRCVQEGMSMNAKVEELALRFGWVETTLTS